MHKIIQEVEKHWRNLGGEGGIPAKADFDIIDITPRYWPLISMVEVEYSPRRYKYVVFGSAKVKAYGKDITGQYLDEIDTGGNNQKYAAQFDEAVDQGTPYYQIDSYTKEDGSVYSFDGACFPLKGPDGQVSHLLFVTALSRNHVPYTA